MADRDGTVPLHSQTGWPWPWPWDCGLGLDQLALALALALSVLALLTSLPFVDFEFYAGEECEVRTRLKA